MEGGSVEMRAQGKKGRRREREKERGMERSRDGGRQKAGIRRGRWSERDHASEGVPFTKILRYALTVTLEPSKQFLATESMK